MPTLDVLIAIPLIPLFPLVVTWWLPWERWIPWGKLPKLVLGPYALYAAFAAWHFRFDDWFVLLLTATGIVLIVVGAVEESRPSLPSTTDKKFLQSLDSWLSGGSEIMLLIRYSRAGGSKSFEFFTSSDALTKRLGMLKAETSVIAFRKPQLPFRGYVDDEFIGKCLSLIPEGSEFLALETDPRMATQQWLYGQTSGKSHEELQEVLEGLRGKLVTVGEYPRWQQNSANVISAYVPHQDGSVKAGVYDADAAGGRL